MSEVHIPASDGVMLQGRLRVPASRPVGSVLLCHPHPEFGAHMDVWLLPLIADRLVAEGWTTLRINFRGVGGSGGHQTSGAQEERDVAGGLTWLRAREPGRPVAAVGWSFGAMMTIRAGAALDAWVGIGPPTQPVAAVTMVGPLHGPELPPHRTVVVGQHDQFFPPDTVHVLAPDRVIVIPDADHFLFDADPQVAQAVAEALRIDLLGGDATAGDRPAPNTSGLL